MSLINKWILNRAEKIKKKQELIEKEKTEKRQERYNLLKEHKTKLRVEIEKNLHEESNKYNEEPTHINVEDDAILNIYSMGREGYNGWDGGVGSLLSNIPKEEETKPVTLKITKIYVDHSLSNEIIDNFFDNHSDEWLYEKITVDNVFKFFVNWRTVKLNDVSTKKLYDKRKILGLYKTAHFEYDGSFKPKWGLNIDCFLKKGTPEYDRTYVIWEKEIDIKKKLQDANDLKKALELEKRKIEEEYRGYKYLN